jgi:hypothetical protein
MFRDDTNVAKGIRSLTLLVICGGWIACTQTGPPSGLHEQPRGMYSLQSDAHLDSICRAFHGDSIGHAFTVTDKRVLGASCYKPEAPAVGGLPAMCFALDASRPCTVSVILSDSTGAVVDWSHYAVISHTAPQTFCVGKMFPRAHGTLRYNVLLNGDLVLSCAVRLFSGLWGDSAGS